MDSKNHVLSEGPDPEGAILEGDPCDAVFLQNALTVRFCVVSTDRRCVKVRPSHDQLVLKRHHSSSVFMNIASNCVSSHMRNGSSHCEIEIGIIKKE